MLNYLTMLTKDKASKIKKEVGDESQLPTAFSVLADPGRFKIFKLLLKHKDMCVTDVASVLEVSLPAASQQLKIMEMSGLVLKRRDGQMICYELRENTPMVKSLAKIIDIIK